MVSFETARYGEAAGGGGLRKPLCLKAKTTRPIGAVDNLHQLRHNINYYGHLPSKAEAEDARSIAESCFEPLFDAVMDEQDGQ